MNVKWSYFSEHKLKSQTSGKKSFSIKTEQLDL